MTRIRTLAELRDLDGRTVPAAPMPAALAATIDPGKAGPGPVDSPAELARRVRVLEDARLERIALNYPEENPR